MKDVKKEIPQEDINNYEIRCVYKINISNYRENQKK